VNFVGTTGFNAANGSPTNFNPSTTQNIFNNTIALQMSLPIFSGGFNTSVIRQRAALLDKANPITTIYAEPLLRQHVKPLPDFMAAWLQ
jgi:hypothetical protein